MKQSILEACCADELSKQIANLVMGEPILKKAFETMHSPHQRMWCDKVSTLVVSIETKLHTPVAPPPPNNIFTAVASSSQEPEYGPVALKPAPVSQPRKRKKKLVKSSE